MLGADGGGGGGEGASFDAEAVAAGISGIGTGVAGAVEAFDGERNSTDPEVIASRDAGQRKIGQGMIQVGGAVASIGAMAAPWGLIASAVGAAIAANGAIIAAVHTRDPVKVALKNAFRKQGHSRAYSKQMADLVGRPLPEVVSELEKHAGKRGWRDREREQAARDLIASEVVDAATQTTAVVVEKRRYAKQQVEAAAENRRVLLLTWGLVLLTLTAMFIAARMRR